MTEILDRFIKNRYSLFALFFIVTLIVFYPSRYSGLVHDFVGWQEAYDQGSWLDIVNCFGYKGLHQVLHFVFFSLYQVLKTNAIGWYIVFALFHSGVVFMTYLWLQKLQEVYQFKLFNGAAMAGALFVLFHPHSTEVVIWKVCIHYILSAIWLLGMMLLYLKYIQVAKRKYLIWLWVLFALSLFTLEISYVYPAFMLLMLIVTATLQKSFQTFGRHLVAIFLPMCIIFGAHLLLNRWILGSWVGHYGPEVHLNFDLLTVASNEYKYLVKHLSLLRFSTFKIKVAIFDTMSNPFIGFHLLLGTIGLIIFWATRLNRFKVKTQMAFWGLFGFFILILPIANMYFYHLMLAPNDRFGYVPIILLTISILVLIDAIPSQMKYIILAAWLGTNLFFHQKLVFTWQKSTIAFESLTNEFRWYDREKVINLNLPDNYNGILIYSVIEEPSGFAEVLEYNQRKKYKGTMYDVYMYNMMTLQDGVKVEQIGPTELKVEFNQWGNWWFKDGIGAGNIETEYFKTRNEGHHYILEIKEPALDATFIYQDGLSLKEFPFDPNWKTGE